MVIKDMRPDHIPALVDSIDAPLPLVQLKDIQRSASWGERQRVRDGHLGATIGAWSATCGVRKGNRPI